jgi:L-fuconolactonase
MKLDSHQHFWKYNETDYSWISENMTVLKKDFLPADLEKELQDVCFDGTIAVQARQSMEETLWLLELASKYSYIKGVVGWVDLCSPEVEIQLSDLSKNPKLVGVRHVIHDEPDDNFIKRQDFQHGISLLSKYNLTYDLLIFPKHLKLASELVKMFPELKFVVDHIAKPNIKEQIYSPWNDDIRDLSKFSNVFCKLSGMVTEADWNSWKPSDFKYYFDVVFDCFGDDRLMIGSDWPVCTVAGSYKKIISLVTDYLTQFSAESKQKVIGENCRKFYLE